MVDAELEWTHAAQSLGLHPVAGDVLPQEVRAALAAQMQSFMESGNYESALEPGWLLVYDDPWNSDFALDFALCLQHLGELESACRFYSTALLLDPGDAYCLYRIGECLQGLGELEEARAALQEALDLSRHDAAYQEVGDQAQQRLDMLAQVAA